MVESLRARLLISFVTITLCVVWLVPNFVDFDEEDFWPTKDYVVYGLDIQGGLHMVLEADIQTLVKERISRMVSQIKEEVKGDFSLNVKDKTPSVIDLKFSSPNSLNKVKEHLKKQEYSVYLQILKEEPSRLQLAFFENRVTELKKQAVDQTIEVIRNRIDEFGVSEPLISSQGEDRILIQLPGVEDSAQTKKLIQKTARLEFAVVEARIPAEKLQALIDEAEKKGGYSLEKGELTYRDYVKRLNKDLKSLLKQNEKIVFERAPSAKTLKAGKIPYLVNTSAGLQGGLLEDAFVSFDPDFNRPEVSFKFEPEGRRIFSDLTGKIVGQRLAVVLDQVLKSAPVVEGRINDNARITLGAGDYDALLEEANMIATTLRAGSLPVDLKQLEERTVGPTLGRDSINKGKYAGIISLIFVMIFMFVYYKTLGFVANISLTVNMAFLLGLLSSLSATLTLPGVAGIILTIGMAVDANVIIFERIKEELKKGSSLKLAIKQGFGHAFSAILDANITTAIVCSVLIYFGTGPIRGFAVTLFCGILTSLFTAVFLSRTLLEVFLVKFGLRRI